MIKYIIGFVVASVLWGILLYNTEIPTYRVYDCGMAEWHPDIPNSVKEECRKQRRERKNTNEITT